MPGPPLHAILPAFGLEHPRVEIESWGSGHIHDTYRVTAGATCALVQRINHRVFRRPQVVTETIRRVTDHLRRHLRCRGVLDVDRRVLRVLPTLDGSPCHQHDDGTWWRAFPFVSGGATHDQVRGPAMARAAARAFGGFQHDLSDLPPPRLPVTLPSFHDLAHRLRDLDASVEEDGAGRVADVASEIAFVLERRHLTELPLDVPERVTHNDTKLNNVLFDGDTHQALCVIDLDTVMPGVGLHDFGDMVRTMVTTAPEDETDLGRVQADPVLFRALADGYIESMRDLLTPREVDLLEPSGRRMAYMVGIRFLTDHLRGDRYFRVLRPSHNLDRAQAQFALLRSLEAQESTNRRAVELAVR